MAFVLDASIVVAWAFDEVNAVASETRERIRREGAAAPTLWWFEVRNALVQGERRGRFSEFATARFLRDISRLAITIDRAPSEQGVLTLARRHRLTVYDASYLELAQREALPLATLDKELATAAGAEQVPLIGADIR
jgi:predicted nucleic acid-binding protein